MINLLSSGVFSSSKENNRINEDCILPPQRVGHGYLMAVADGVGSYAGAATASRAAINCLQEISSQRWSERISSIEIFTEIKNKITEISISDEIASDAATTLTFCYVSPEGVRIGHVGDCRAYIRSGLGLKQVTTDHTQHQRLMDEGLYKAHELKRLGGRNTLFAAISKKLDLYHQDIFINYSDLETEELKFDIILMSDGAHQVWDMRPRFALSTLSDPNRFAVSLRRRINWVGPMDDYSFISSKFMITESVFN